MIDARERVERCHGQYVFMDMCSWRDGHTTNLKLSKVMLASEVVMLLLLFASCTVVVSIVSPKAQHRTRILSASASASPESTDPLRQFKLPNTDYDFRTRMSRDEKVQRLRYLLNHSEDMIVMPCCYG